jgi:hypothetical protein
MRLPDVNLAVLGADRQSTVVDGTNAPQKYLEGRKLWISDSGVYAFGHSGTRGEDLVQLINNMKTGKIDLGEVISKGKFEQLRELNVNRLGTKRLDPSKESGFLLINRDGTNTNLYTCWPFGDVEHRAWTEIGSGAERVEDYIKALQILNEAKSYLGNSKSMTSDDVIRVVAEGVRYAQAKDIYSSGLDMVIMTPNQTFDCFTDLQDDFAKRITALQEKVKPKTE